MPFRAQFFLARKISVLGIPETSYMVPHIRAYGIHKLRIIRIQWDLKKYFDKYSLRTRDTLYSQAALHRTPRGFGKVRCNDSTLYPDRELYIT